MVLVYRNIKMEVYIKEIILMIKVVVLVYFIIQMEIYKKANFITV